MWKENENPDNLQSRRHTSLKTYLNRTQWKFSHSSSRSPFQVLDYTQYYLDLESANSRREGAALSGTPTTLLTQTTWQSEYNLTTYYHGLGEISREISAVSLHNLADRFTNPEDALFSK